MSAGSHRSRVSAGKRDRRKPGPARRVLAGSPSHSGAVSIPPPALREGQVRCPVCRNGVSVTPNGHLRKHRDLFGHDCFNRGTEAAIDLTDLPPVTFGTTSAHESVQGMRPVGTCHECSKPIPPGRLLCGRCMSRRRP